MAKEESKKVKNNNFKNFKAELKKVIWPTPKQLANNTVSVITIVLITALIVFVLDFGFELINKYGINKLRDAVAPSESSVVNTVDENEENSEETTTDTTEVTDAQTESNENVVEAEQTENNEEEATTVTEQTENNEADAQNAEETQVNE